MNGQVMAGYFVMQRAWVNTSSITWCRLEFTGCCSPFGIWQRGFIKPEAAGYIMALLSKRNTLPLLCSPL